MQNDVQTITEAKNLVRQLIRQVENVERSFKSARNWGLIDLFGGGMVVDVIKHIKLNSASSQMNEINLNLQRLQQILGGVQIPVDYRMKIGGFSTFADFVFDGVLADAWMTGKIWSSLEQIRELKNKLYSLQGMLSKM